MKIQHERRDQQDHRRATGRPHNAGASRLGADTASAVLHLQRTAGNQAVARLLDPVVQRVPYADAYPVGATKGILNKSEGRPSPVNNQPGHPRQHAGRWQKAIDVAEGQGRTKSVYTKTAEQDNAVASALSSATAQGIMATLDANPAAPVRVQVLNVPTDAAEVYVVKAKKKQGAPAAAGVKSWEYQTGTATKATVIVDSMGDGQPRSIHVQTAYPVYP